MKKGKLVWEYAALAAGSVLVALGVHFFKIPNHFSTGGFSGIGILLGELIEGLNTSTVISVMNYASLAVGFLILGKSIGVRTVFCTVIYAGTVQLLGFLAPVAEPFTSDRLLELIYALLLSSVGTALVFKNGGSTGGTDIVALIVRKYTKSDISVALFAADGLIVFFTFFVFNTATGLYSLLGLIMKSLAVQSVIDALNRRKSLLIVTTHPEEVSLYITDTMHRSATMWKGEGVFTDSSRSVLLTALTSYQAAKVNAYVKKIDKEAFIIVNHSHEIYGKGFLSIEAEKEKSEK